MSEGKEIGTSETTREDWGDGGQGSGRAGAPHSEPEGQWTPVGNPSKGAQRYSGPLADLDDGKEAPGQELEPANSPTVTEDERRELVEGIEDRAAPPTAYADLPASAKELVDEDGWDNVNHEIGGAREHLSHEDYDTLDAAIGNLPKALNEKLFVALGSGEFESLQEVVEHLADGIPANQMQSLRNVIDELPSRIRDEIEI